MLPDSHEGDFYKRIFENMLEGCQILSFDWTYLYLNATAERHNRRPNRELLGRKYQEMWPGVESTAVYGLIRQCLEQRIPSEIENEFIFPDGTPGWFELRISPIPEGVFVMSIDITSRKTLEKLLRESEDKLQQMQKMEAVGRLAAGVAHDFNNMLSVILGHVELAAMGENLGDRIRANLVEIRRAADSSSNLTKQLLAFARKQTTEPTNINLNSLVSKKLNMIQSLLGKHIKIDWLPADDLKLTTIDVSQFEQVMLNLCINARDAIGNDGAITLETHNVEVDSSYIDTHPEATEGKYVQFAVSDTGCGIAKEDLSKVFEPFFTSKQLGRGTGLGLSIVYGIVRQNGGFVNIYSEVGKGSTFRVYFPCELTGVETTRTIDRDDYLNRGSETVILVDDEPSIVNVTKQMLESLGYHVLASSDPEEATRIATEYPREIHLLCTDVMLQHTTGPALAARIQSNRPTMKLLYTSGFTENVVVHNGVLDAGINFLNKPYTIKELNRKVREALDSL